MPDPLILNLVGIGWPVCLMKFKIVLDSIELREILEVQTKDPNVAKNIIMIADNSHNPIIKQERESNLYRIFIQKGQ